MEGVHHGWSTLPKHAYMHATRSYVIIHDSIHRLLLIISMHAYMQQPVDYHPNLPECSTGQ